MWKAVVYVTVKEGVLDPEGQAVERALHSLGYGEASGVRVGKYIELTLDTADRDEAESRLKQMCEKLLTNPVVEDYRYELEVASS
mgnify:CR=1 FL=1|jgi:phosphoribosylformylglycinamidine synthase PurS subunit